MELEKTRRVVKCELCDMEMELKEGTIIYGSKLFHNSCWSSANYLSSKPLDIARAVSILLMRTSTSTK